MPDPSRFIFVICQHGAEAATKKELAGHHPELKFAFSRPGFLTFKLDENQRWPEKFSLKSTLARTSGWTLGKFSGTDADPLIEQVLEQSAIRLPEKSSSKGANVTSETINDVNKYLKLIVPNSDGEAEVRHLHIWQRDPRLPGDRGFEPGPTVLAQELGDLIASRLGEYSVKIRVNQVARVNECVLDIILVEPHEWWLGYHYATSPALRWPGGVPRIDQTTEPISRAYFKAAEALLWSGIEIQPGDWCAEIGSAPGGACQLLLEKGANVIGIDPAEMDEELLKSDRFIHIRRRGNEVRKKDLSEVKWLFADVNLVPNYTLDTITEIVSHEKVHVKGMVLTMKLPDWKLLDKLSEIRARVTELGFGLVKTRQLAFNRQEFCLVAVRDKFVLRKGKQKKSAKLNPKNHIITKKNRPAGE
jgi:23S rRNA (cytidine2498-2'-O)-methyltransferase